MKTKKIASILGIIGVILMSFSIIKCAMYTSRVEQEQKQQIKIYKELYIGMHKKVDDATNEILKKENIKNAFLSVGDFCIIEFPVYLDIIDSDSPIFLIESVDVCFIESGCRIVLNDNRSLGFPVNKGDIVYECRDIKTGEVILNIPQRLLKKKDLCID